MSPRHRVLIVDDSAFARKVIRETLQSSGFFDIVGIARDGLEALELIERLSPDVVTLDLVMPNLDGLGVLDALGKSSPPVVVVSVSGADSQMGVAALLKGAVDVVEKPSALATDRLYEMRDDLVSKVLAAVSSQPHFDSVEALPVSQIESRSRFELLAIGASTGGPRALTTLLSNLPIDLPVPVVAALHIPEGYTRALADRIALGSRLRVTEGYDGAPLDRGTAVIVPGGTQAEVVRLQGGLQLALSSSASSRPYKPSIDLLFESAARAASPVLAAVLTGMGNDGTEGARAIVAGRGRVLTESRESCVIYGMPRSVVDAGLSYEAAPIDRLANALVQSLASRQA